LIVRCSDGPVTDYGYGDGMRPATTLTMVLLLGAIFVAGIISLLQL